MHRIKETIAFYRHFLTSQKPFRSDDIGREVFEWLIRRTGVFTRIDTEEQRVLHNFGIELLENAGLTQGRNYRRLVNDLTRYPIPEQAIDGEANGRR